MINNVSLLSPANHRIRRVRFLSLLFLLTGLLVYGSAKGEPDPPLHLLKLPPRFTISLYTKDVPNARSLALGAKGTVFVGSIAEGNVYAVVDQNGDHQADHLYLVAKNLISPNGVAFHKGSLYIADIDRILRLDRIEEQLNDPPQPVVVTDSLPSDRHHGWRFISFGPDGLLYVPIGAPCNVCERADERYASLLRMQPDGSGLEVFARGIRNTVGFDWHPETKELWFTDNGRDMLGDDAPPDELNRASRKGLHFGFPYCHGGTIADPQFGAKHSCDEFTPPALRLGPHVAAIGMRFYTGAMFPTTYRNQIFIAEHGSWNRKEPIGYRLSLARFTDEGSMKYEVFAEGWRQDNRTWGRPADILVMPDGALLVSDDTADAIYRISYSK